MSLDICSDDFAPTSVDFGMYYAVTITTKLPCRHCPVEFDNALYKYLKSKNVDTGLFSYKLEESKYTKWHCHGEYPGCAWSVDKNDDFYAYFRKCYDRKGWDNYCNKASFSAPPPDEKPYFIPE